MPKDHEVTQISLADSEVTTATNTTGEFSNIIDIQVPAGMRYVFPSNWGMQMYVYTHESATVTTDSGTETVNLSNNIVNSPTVRDVPTSSSETSTTGQYSLVVWDDTDDIQTGVASVDYAANSFDYTTSDTTDDDLEIWYLWGDSAQVEFRRYTPSEEDYDKELIKTMREFHEADVFNTQSQITFGSQFSMREKEHLKVSVKTDVDLTNWDVIGPSPSSSPGDFTTYGYSDIRIPVKKVPMRQ